MEFQTIDLFHWDYLIVDCGYVHRLIARKDDIISKTTIDTDDYNDEEHALMFFIDYDYNSDTKKSSYKMIPVQSDDDDVWGALMGLIKRKKLSSVQAVCFKREDSDVNLVEILQEYRHCACFGGSPDKIASFKTKNGKIVLYKQFDTESG